MNVFLSSQNNGNDRRVQLGCPLVYTMSIVTCHLFYSYFHFNSMCTLCTFPLVVHKVLTGWTTDVLEEQISLWENKTNPLGLRPLANNSFAAHSERRPGLGAK